MSVLSNLFGGGRRGDPSQAAIPYFQQAQDVTHQYLDPYTQYGPQMGDMLSKQYSQMAQDPAAMLEQLMSGYQPSKGYGMMQERLGQALSNTAAAGGARGGEEEMFQQGELTQGLLSQDMQRYLQNILGLHQEGLEGGRAMYGLGEQAATGAAGDIGNILGTEGSLAFQGKREGQQRGQDLISSLLGAAGMIGGAYLGGPAGAAIGSKAGKIGGRVGSQVGSSFFGGR